MPRSFRMNLSLDAELHEAIARVAEDERRSLGDVVRDRLRASFFGQEADDPIRGVGDLARKLILEGLSNGAVLLRVHEQFPHANTTPDSVSWYRSELRRAGHEVPTSIEAERR